MTADVRVGDSNDIAKFNAVAADVSRWFVHPIKNNKQR
jgi:hypothetical protein